MSNFLTRLATRSLHPNLVLKPRLPSRFESSTVAPKAHSPLSAATTQTSPAPVDTIHASSTNWGDWGSALSSVQRQPLGASMLQSIHRDLPPQPGTAAHMANPRESQEISSLTSRLVAKPVSAPIKPLKPVGPFDSRAVDQSETTLPPLLDSSVEQEGSTKQRTPITPSSLSDLEGITSRDTPYLYPQLRIKTPTVKPVSLRSSISESGPNPIAAQTSELGDGADVESDQSLADRPQVRSIQPSRIAIRPALVGPEQASLGSPWDRVNQTTLQPDPKAVTPGFNRLKPSSSSELRPLISEHEPFPSAAKPTDSPRLIIDHLTVEVVSSPASPPVAPARPNPRSVKPSARSASASSSSKLRFGLGQL